MKKDRLFLVVLVIVLAVTVSASMARMINLTFSTCTSDGPMGWSNYQYTTGFSDGHKSDFNAPSNPTACSPKNSL